MNHFRRTVLICNLVLVALLTSVFGIASANSYVYTSYPDGTEAMLKMEAPALDCQKYEDIQTHNEIAWESALAMGKDAKASHQCCPSINVTTLFPATFASDLQSKQTFSLALIQHESLGKTKALSESIFRPPIG
ncbi:hypothetical protein P7F88_06720 [Vibrio hannami]|uniref:hypothetical protein n=1 Tax=Vibrio hannami TaxID=2717094 RepID=UPI0024100463|nr:hypothetical protein [Vibrio hannami]MDG3085804.1 hypothetical protein [Vibrio hannami]